MFRKKETNHEDQKSSVNLRERLQAGLAKTRRALFSDLGDLFSQNKLDLATLEELENRLLMADAGVAATTEIIDQLRQSAGGNDPLAALREILRDRLLPHEQAMELPHAPAVILVIGVNGVGKTTTIGKLARRIKKTGKQVMLAAGDTFRAAAVEQLQGWGQRIDVPVIAQSGTADAASVIYDAMTAATSRGIDVLIADTAGRLQNKSHLMEELAKIKRVLGKLDPAAPHETLLVLDGGTGQNALAQTRQFHEAIGITGLIVTKLDGTARGGILFALAREFDLPIRYIGVGEQADDLRDFTAAGFVDALLDLPADAGKGQD